MPSHQVRDDPGKGISWKKTEKYEVHLLGALWTLPFFGQNEQTVEALPCISSWMVSTICTAVALSRVSNLDWRFHPSACSELDSTQAIGETGTNDLEKYWSTTTSQQHCLSVATKPLSHGGDLLLPEVVHNSQSCLLNAAMLCCTTRKEAMCYLLLYTFEQTSNQLYAHSAMLFGLFQVSSSQTFPHKQRDGDPKGSLHTTR